MANETPRTNGVHSIKADDGIFLKGLVVASEVVDKVWDGSSYKQLKVTITNGVKSFFYVMSDKMGVLPTVEPFKRAFVRVDAASTDKGVLTVRGEFSHE